MKLYNYKYNNNDLCDRRSKKMIKNFFYNEVYDVLFDDIYESLNNNYYEDLYDDYENLDENLKNEFDLYIDDLFDVFWEYYLRTSLNEDNLEPRLTGLEYYVWIDQAGYKRDNKHKGPRIKVGEHINDAIPVSISNQPKILAKNRKLAHFRKVSDWIIEYKKQLLKIWFGHLSIDKFKSKLKKQ